MILLITERTKRKSPVGYVKLARYVRKPEEGGKAPGGGRRVRKERERERERKEGRSLYTYKVAFKFIHHSIQRMNAGRG